ncbi:MAG TPA: hypothetical protein VN946_10740 [Terriglobales bacterium]|jgi:hypothetical protein|nr:hypothetical protein [Terriglobales bacterium]
MINSRSDSNAAEVLTFTSSRPEIKPKPIEIRISATSGPLMTLDPAEPSASEPQKHRSKSKVLNPKEKRMKRIRGLLAKMSTRPDPEKYCDWMDQVRMSLPESIRHSGKFEGYRDAYRVKKHAATIRSELSRAWNGLK